MLRTIKRQSLHLLIADQLKKTNVSVWMCMHAHIQAAYLLNVTLFIILGLQSVVKKAIPCSSSSSCGSGD